MAKLTGVLGTLEEIAKASKEADALIAADKASRVKEKFPLDLVRAKPKTQQEITDIADRVARQQLGEHVTSGKAGDTRNLAGRSMKESKRVQDLQYNLERTKDIQPSTVYNRQLGDIDIALPGDQTISDFHLLDINGHPIESTQEGGSRYGLGHKDKEDPLFWASGTNVAQSFQNKVNNLADLYNTDRIMAHHLAMGSDSNNFAQHMADANLRAIANTDVHPKNMEAFNDIIKQGYTDQKGKHTFEDFAGIHNPEEAYLQMQADPNLRKFFNNRMKVPKITDSLGLPNGLDIQWAVTEPELRNMEINLTGHSVGKMKPQAELTDTANHNTYESGIQGEAQGHTEELAPFEMAFPDATGYVRSVQRPQDFTGTIQKVFPSQVVDDQHLNEMNEYYKRLREIRGFKDGGSANLEDNIKDKIKDFYRKWKDSATEMFGDYPMPLESSTEYKDTMPSPRMGAEGTTIYSKNHYAKGGSIEDDYKLADMFTAEPESGGLNYRDYPNPHGVRAFPIKDKQGNITGYGGEELPKYKGWLDVQKGTGKLKGSKVTEYSMDDAKGSFPTMTPLLSQAERDSVASGNVTPEIYAKAILWRDHMVEQGKSPFLNPEGFAKGGRPVTPQMELPSAQKVGQVAKILGNKALEQLKKETANPSTQMVRDVVLNTGAGIAGMPSDMIQGARGEPMKGYKPFNTSTKQQGTGIPMAGTENLEAQLAKYGLTSGTQRPLLENALMMFGPTAVSKVGKLAKLTKDMPVGLSIKDVSPKKTEFHSTLNKTIDTHKMEAMSGPQWSAWLKSNAPKSAKKEAEATGLHDWLETQGKVSKEDIKAHTEANRPEVKAITRGNSGKMTFADNERLKDLWTRNNDSVRHREGEGLTTDEYTELMKLENMRDKHSVSTLRNQQSEQERSAQQAQARGDNATANMRFNMAEHFGNRADALELNPEEMGGGTKFNTWQLPGGENYKETTLALPSNKNKSPDDVAREMFGKSMNDISFQDQEKVRENLRSNDNNYKVPHAHAYGNEDSDTNRVAHIRTNERLTPDDKKALFLEELQSDWAQQGRDIGFAKNKLTPDEEREYNMLTEYGSRQLSPESSARMRELSARKYSSEIPSGPYVTDTKDWTALGLKHALKQAVDEGHDYLGWTTGEQQANRYDLSKHIDELYYNPETKELQGHKGTKTIFDKEGVEPEHLDELVGKDVAAKLTTMSPNWTNIHPEGRILSGLDLQVGGEGMKGYYDKIVPQTMNDIMKQIGSKERVKPIQIQSGEPKDFDINHTVRADGSEVVEVNGQEHVFDNAEDAQAFRDSVFQPTTHQGIEITPELREQIQSEGLPHYHDGGNVSKKVNLEDEFKIAQLRKNYG